MELFLTDLKRLPRLFVGFIFLSLGITLTKEAAVGMDPWGVFHEGLDNIIDFLTFGQIIQVLGILIMIISFLLFQTKIGIGTILNALLVGWIVDLFGVLINVSFENIMMNYLILFFGLLTMTFGRALYISAELGPGPRDGLFVGLTRITGINVKYGKPMIEAVVLISGFLMGGTVSYGTLILILSTGYVVHFFFRRLHFDPKQKRQSDIVEYFKQNKKVSNV